VRWAELCARRHPGAALLHRCNIVKGNMQPAILGVRSRGSEEPMGVGAIGRCGRFSSGSRRRPTASCTRTPTPGCPMRWAATTTHPSRQDPSV
jgi:hypothetical protein